MQRREGSGCGVGDLWGAQTGGLVQPLRSSTSTQYSKYTCIEIYWRTFLQLCFFVLVYLEHLQRDSGSLIWSGSLLCFRAAPESRLSRRWRHAAVSDWRCLQSHRMDQEWPEGTRVHPLLLRWTIGSDLPEVLLQEPGRPEELRAAERRLFFASHKCDQQWQRNLQMSGGTGHIETQESHHHRRAGRRHQPDGCKWVVVFQRVTQTFMQKRVFDALLLISRSKHKRGWEPDWTRPSRIRRTSGSSCPGFLRGRIFCWLENSKKAEGSDARDDLAPQHGTNQLFTPSFYFESLGDDMSFFKSNFMKTTNFFSFHLLKNNIFRAARCFDL